VIEVIGGGLNQVSLAGEARSTLCLNIRYWTEGKQVDVEENRENPTSHNVYLQAGSGLD
jgi:hypothetical protein